MTTTIYVLNEGVAYEGEKTLGVYSTRERALHAARNYIEVERYIDTLHIYEFALDAEAEPQPWDEDAMVWNRRRGGWQP